MLDPSPQTFPIKKVDPFVLLAANIAKLFSSSIHRSGKLGSRCPLVRVSDRAAFGLGYLCPPDGFDIPSIV